MAKFFKLKENSTNVHTEIIAGAILGTNAAITYVESAAGVEEGEFIRSLPQKEIAAPWPGEPKNAAMGMDNSGKVA